MQKKEYCSPELTLIELSLKEVILSSPEFFNSHLDSSSDDWGDPSLPDDDLNW